MIPFNQKKHSDITVTISEGDCSTDESRTFFLHKFPLISKSVYFDHNIPVPEPPTAAASVEMKISHFPGGPNAFETVARYCYGLDIELTVENIAPVYCASRVLQVTDLEKTTEEFMQNIVLTDIVKSATVLKITAGISNMTEAMMAGLVGHCINAIAVRFAPIPELNSLPPECFVVVVKTARDMDVQKRVLETAVLAYLKTHISPESGKFILCLSIVEIDEYRKSLYNVQGKHIKVSSNVRVNLFFFFFLKSLQVYNYRSKIS